MPDPAQHLVLDANVGKSAMNPATAAAALQAAEVLKAISKTPALGLAMSPALAHEWRQWASGYAMTWLMQMVSRTKAVATPAHESASLRAAIDALPQNDRVPLAKDCHLIELALCTSQRIVSFEKKARVKCLKLRTAVPAIADLLWAGPQDTEVIVWLHAGTPYEPAYLITTPARW